MIVTTALKVSDVEYIEQKAKDKRISRYKLVRLIVESWIKSQKYKDQLT